MFNVAVECGHLGTKNIYVGFKLGIRNNALLDFL